MLIPLPKGYFAIIDDEDFERVSSFRWYASKTKLKEAEYLRVMAFSPVVDGKRDCLLLHRVVMQAPKGLAVDHINRNPLDCRKANLRICTTQQNTFNRTGRLPPLRGSRDLDAEGVIVRRGKAWIFSGCDSRPAT